MITRILSPSGSTSTALRLRQVVDYPGNEVVGTVNVNSLVGNSTSIVPFGDDAFGNSKSIKTKTAPSQIWKTTASTAAIGSATSPYLDYAYFVNTNGLASTPVQPIAHMASNSSLLMIGAPGSSYGTPPLTITSYNVGAVLLLTGANFSTVTRLEPPVASRTQNRCFGLQVRSDATGANYFVTSRNTATTQDVLSYVAGTLDQTITGVVTTQNSLDCASDASVMVAGNAIYRRTGSGLTLAATMAAGEGTSSRCSSTGARVFSITTGNGIAVRDRSGNSWNLTTTITSATFGSGTLLGLECSDDGNAIALYTYDEVSGRQNHRLKRLTFNGSVWSKVEDFLLVSNINDELLSINSARRTNITMAPDGTWLAHLGIISYLQDFVS